MLPALAADSRFVVAAISLKEATIYEGGGGELRPVALADLPRGMENLFGGGPDARGEGQTRSDGTVRKPVTANAADAPANADAGSQKQVSNDEAIQYLKQIAACLDQYLGGSGVPLVVVADERLAGHFRRVCRYPVLVEPMITVPPDSLDPATLHSHAREVLRPRFDQARRDALDRVRQGVGGGGGTASTHPAEIVAAALQGRVETLLLRQGGACWGRWLPKEQTAILHHARHPGDEDLLDLAAAHTMVTGGRVFELDVSDMPPGQVMAALLRF
ncbi:hypothetical protein [Oleisolibacter albus]|uniref:baeRF3 domain-containing protein n=1 Tax=Oleisolibacter albus TaxID=2171757 RepID=UPI0013905219|nr:hypothetical protein [Oleisolibacter albus]